MFRSNAPGLLLGALALLPACSEGAPSSAEPPIVVQSAAGKVVIERAPFALHLEDAAGATVLALGAEARTVDGVLYAPLLLTTGDDDDLRVPVLPGVPDTNPASPRPAESYAIRAVTSATANEQGAEVTLSTTDPEGRTITLHVAPEQDDAFVLSIAASGDGTTAVGITLAAGADEAFHGFGGRRESTNLRGRVIKSWVLDYRFPDVSPAYYDAAPAFVSSRGYGLLLDQDDYAVFRVASDADDALGLRVASPSVKLVLAPGAAGAPAKAMAALSARTGRNRVAPAWSMGPTISRAVWTSKTTADYQQAIADDLDKIEADKLAISAYCFEGWALLPEGFVASTIATLRARGIHPVLYIRSFVGKDAGGTQLPADFDEAIAKGYVAKNDAGEPYLSPSPFTGDMAVIDFTNPAAADWWKAKVKAMLDLGADGFMCDFGEQVLRDMVFADGSRGAQMHNRYPVLQHKAAREVISDYEAEHPERQIYLFGRAGYTGRPGAAAYLNATFPGDELDDFSKGAGLPSIIPDMLNRSILGGYGFTTDIAGYADFKFTPATKELYQRWSEAAALTPFFRVHNGPLTGPRMPWSYDAETEATWVAMAALHESVVPLLRSLWEEGRATGMPVIRPLWLVEPGAASGAHDDDEWMVGDDLLAAPVVQAGKTEREVYLPAGCWQAHGEGPTLTGGTIVNTSAKLGDLPWFRRCAGP
ncbi:MAG: glycoside hydrolase family 31 protein [Byssovorax sp.]